MKGIKILIILSVIILPHHAFCQAQTPVEFNNTVVDIIDSFAKLGIEWTDAFSKISTATKTYSDLSVERKKMTSYVDQEVSLLKAMKDVNGSDSFKLAAINYLIFEKKSNNKRLSPHRKINHYYY